MVTGRPTEATAKAVALIGKPRPGGGKHTAYSAAKVVGIALSTIYRSPLYRALRAKKAVSK